MLSVAVFEFFCKSHLRHYAESSVFTQQNRHRSADLHWPFNSVNFFSEDFAGKWRVRVLPRNQRHHFCPIRQRSDIKFKPT
ncbi:MAG TPA: hypothetical protein DCG57_03210 [Candidatus Riflebacteria bacterium]|nr:hypothetical protein [Candidatus Riflebacteria bacterium]